MASTVLSGTNTSLSYTNNTGQNVRVVINYLSTTANATLVAGKMTLSPIVQSSNDSVSFGRNLAFRGGDTNSGLNYFGPNKAALPTEVMLAAGEVFSVTGSNTYNIIVIPEAG